MNVGRVDDRQADILAREIRLIGVDEATTEASDHEPHPQGYLYEPHRRAVLTGTARSQQDDSML